MIPNTGAFVGKTIFVSGGSRGIGKAIALKLAKDGANVVIAAKTTEKHPKLEGTIFTAAQEIEAAGGKCLPVQCDLRDEDAVKNAFDKTLQKFGGLDVLVNNASAISLTGTEDTTMKKYDLMHQINIRGTFMSTKYAIPALKKGNNPHILNLSPPLLMEPIWFGPHVAYTMAKYGMSMCVLGMAQEFKEYGIGVNALWPRTAIWTAAMAMLGGGGETAKMCRTVDIIADSAYSILSEDSKKVTGNFFIDEVYLREKGVTDFDQYAIVKGGDLMADFFIPQSLMKGLVSIYSSSDNAKEGDSVNNDSGIVDKIFAKAQSVITDEVKKQLNAVMVFNVSGKNYLIDAHASRPLKIELVTDPPKSDVTMVTDEETFIKMSKGEVKPTSAFMSGKLKIKGNIAIGMKFEKLFKELKV